MPAATAFCWVDVARSQCIASIPTVPRIRFAAAKLSTTPRVRSAFGPVHMPTTTVLKSDWATTPIGVPLMVERPVDTRG